MCSFSCAGAKNVRKCVKGVFLADSISRRAIFVLLEVVEEPVRCSVLESGPTADGI